MLLLGFVNAWHEPRLNSLDVQGFELSRLDGKDAFVRWRNPAEEVLCTIYSMAR